MKYTKEQRLDIGRKLYSGEISRRQAAEIYDISEQSARDYMRLYRDSEQLPPKQAAKHSISAPSFQTPPAGIIKPIITVSPINEKLLSAIGQLIAQLGKIGGNLNQIARYLNERGTPYNSLSGKVRAAIADLADVKFEILRKVGDAVGDVQTLKL